MKKTPEIEDSLNLEPVCFDGVIDVRTSIGRANVAGHLVANFQSLIEGTGLNSTTLLPLVVTRRGLETYTGKKMVEITIAPTIGSIAKTMGWNLSSPEVVYLSGFYFYQYFTTRVNDLENRFKEVEEGRTTFINDDYEEKTTTNWRNELEKIKEVPTKISQALEKHARENLNQKGDDYLRALRLIPYFTDLMTENPSAQSARKTAVDLLKQGRIAECLKLMTSYRLPPFLC